MFSLTVLDHVRLDSEHAARNYTVHARAADRLATSAFAARLVMASLLAASVAAGVGNLLFTARFYQIATVVSSSLALIAFALNTIFGIEARVLAHRALAHRLWIVCERYRALLAEAGDGFVDRAMLLNRRDQLTEQLHAIYATGFGPDQRAFEQERLPGISVQAA